MICSKREKNIQNQWSSILCVVTNVLLAHKYNSILTLGLSFGNRMTRSFCSALPPSWRSNRSSYVCPARALGTVSASWKPHPTLRWGTGTLLPLLFVQRVFFLKKQLCFTSLLSAECAPGLGHMYLHSGAVPVSSRSAGDAGQHGGDDRGRPPNRTKRNE